MFLQIQSLLLFRPRKACRIVVFEYNKSRRVIYPQSYCIKKLIPSWINSALARVKKLLCALAEGLLLDFFCPEGNKAEKVTAHRNENETNRPTMPHLSMYTYLYPTVSYSPPDHLQISYVSQHTEKKTQDMLEWL